jgi:hypothetical protein
MSLFWWGVVFGGICVVAAVVICVACLHAFAVEDAAATAARAERERKWRDQTADVEPDWCNAPHPERHLR